MPCAEVIEVGFGSSFFAGELVVVGIATCDGYFATKRVVVRLLLDRTSCVGNYACGPEMIGEVVVNSTCRYVTSSDPPTVEENVLSATL
jgi:hypothetical protein